jgi:hypothetical protein
MPLPKPIFFPPFSAVGNSNVRRSPEFRARKKFRWRIAHLALSMRIIFVCRNRRGFAPAPR